jgi:predicted HAD superfamily Cof-like phosphohydrolase
VADGMKPLQKEWEKSKKYAPDDLNEIDGWVGSAYFLAKDRISIYAEEQDKKINELLDYNKEEIFTWAAREEYGLTREHRREIAKLLEILIEGDIKALQNFADTVLADISPTTANEIKNKTDFNTSLAVIEDPVIALTYLRYASLMLQAVPPNFYALVGAHQSDETFAGGASMANDFILLFALTLFSREGANHHIQDFSDRLSEGYRELKAPKKIKDAAVQGLIAVKEMFYQLTEISHYLYDYGNKLLIVRQNRLLESSKNAKDDAAEKKPQKRVSQKGIKKI